MMLIVDGQVVTGSPEEIARLLAIRTGKVGRTDAFGNTGVWVPTPEGTNTEPTDA